MGHLRDEPLLPHYVIPDSKEASPLLPGDQDPSPSDVSRTSAGSPSSTSIPQENNAARATPVVVAVADAGSSAAKDIGLMGPQRLSYDAVLFFHGLNGLELACEEGKVSEGTCVLFNGASLLLEDGADALSGARLWFIGL